MVWKISNLEKMTPKRAEISLFLFDDVLGDVWKESLGAVVALISPKLSIDKSHGLVGLSWVPGFVGFGGNDLYLLIFFLCLFPAVIYCCCLL